MTIELPPQSTVLFQGDSITDCGRRDDPDGGLGYGYARLAAEAVRAAHPHAAPTFLNRGVSGDRVADLRARWDEDAMGLEPDLVSVLIGVNDTWRRYEDGEATSAAAYEADYRHVLARVRDELGARIVLVEPFVVPVTAEQWAWREDLDPRIHVVRRLAEEFDAALLSADGLLNQAARAVGSAGLVAGDGVHPTPLGHRVLAEAWAGLVSVA
jgi:lysophospholipase L1-like esterase